MKKFVQLYSDYKNYIKEKLLKEQPTEILNLTFPIINVPLTLGSFRVHWPVLLWMLFNRWWKWGGSSTTAELVGVRKGIPPLKTRSIPMGGQLADGDFSTIGRVKPCKVLPEVWLSTLGWTSDPSLMWKKATMMMMIIWWCIHCSHYKISSILQFTLCCRVRCMVDPRCTV